MKPLPPIRRLIQPDHGYVLVDADLKGADAQIVAWEAGAERLKRLFRIRADIHTANATDMWGDSITKEQRQRAKNGVHLTNYGGKERTLASTLGTSVTEAIAFQQRWFELNPEILAWHKKIELQLRLTREITNVWGFKRRYFDRAQNLLQQATAWLGQSGVAGTINKAMLQIRQQLPEVQLLLQVHDSLLMQVPVERFVPERIIAAMSVRVPFKDPLIIPVELKYSLKSWGEMTEWKPNEEPTTASRIKAELAAA